MAKAGDKVEVFYDCYPYFSGGEEPTLNHMDSDGDWWATFLSERTHCIGIEGVDFKVIEEA